MEKYINKYGKECYRGADKDSLFSAELFHKSEHQFETDVALALHTNLGSLTVVDRMTGYGRGIRDTESGFRNVEGDFWLAAGMQDVRESDAKTLGEAIDWVKSHANTCRPAPTKRELSPVSESGTE